MHLIIDVHYRDDGAKIVGVLIDDWQAAKPTLVIELFKTAIADYESGAFYKRELPCLIDVLKTKVIQQLIDNQQLATIVIDGFVYLDDNEKWGLGMYLHDYCQKNIPSPLAIIGVAKNGFQPLQKPELVQQLLRGGSANPLFITAVGIDLAAATNIIKKMDGEFRIPTLLKLTDTLTKA
jgi:deoxyribonuclease V